MELLPTGAASLLRAGGSGSRGVSPRSMYRPRSKAMKTTADRLAPAPREGEGTVSVATSSTAALNGLRSGPCTLPRATRLTRIWSSPHSTAPEDAGWSLGTDLCYLHELVKAAEVCAGSMLLFDRLFAEAGFPARPRLRLVRRGGGRHRQAREPLPQA